MSTNSAPLPKYKKPLCITKMLSNHFYFMNMIFKNKNDVAMAAKYMYHCINAMAAISKNTRAINSFGLHHGQRTLMRALL